MCVCMKTGERRRGSSNWIDPLSKPLFAPLYTEGERSINRLEERCQNDNRLCLRHEERGRGSGDTNRGITHGSTHRERQTEREKAGDGIWLLLQHTYSTHTHLNRSIESVFVCLPRFFSLLCRALSQCLHQHEMFGQGNIFPSPTPSSLLFLSFPWRMGEKESTQATTKKKKKKGRECSVMGFQLNRRIDRACNTRETKLWLCTCVCVYQRRRRREREMRWGGRAGEDHWGMKTWQTLLFAESLIPICVT